MSLESHLQKAIKHNKVVDVSNSTHIILANHDPSKIFIDGIPIISDNYKNYKIALHKLGSDYNEYKLEFALKFGDTKYIYSILNDMKSLIDLQNSLYP